MTPVTKSSFLPLSSSFSLAPSLLYLPIFFHLSPLSPHPSFLTCFLCFLFAFSCSSRTPFPFSSTFSLCLKMFPRRWKRSPAVMDEGVSFIFHFLSWNSRCLPPGWALPLSFWTPVELLDVTEYLERKKVLPEAQRGRGQEVGWEGQVVARDGWIFLCCLLAGHGHQW